jgi:hypothetical protein
MHQVRLYPAQDAPKIQDKARQMARLIRLLPTRPVHLLDFHRQRAVFKRMTPALQLDIEELVTRLGQRQEKTPVMGGIVAGEIQDSH